MKKREDINYSVLLDEIGGYKTTYLIKKIFKGKDSFKIAQKIIDFQDKNCKNELHKKVLLSEFIHLYRERIEELENINDMLSASRVNLLKIINSFLEQQDRLDEIQIEMLEVNGKYETIMKRRLFENIASKCDEICSEAQEKIEKIEELENEDQKENERS